MNRYLITGNLGSDPVGGTTSGGVHYCRFSVASHEYYKDKITGEKKTHVEWHNVVLWRRLAEIALKYLKKGDKVLVDGKHRSKQYEDKNGAVRYSSELEGDTLEMERTPSKPKEPQVSSEASVDDGVPDYLKTNKENQDSDKVNPLDQDDIPF